MENEGEGPLLHLLPQDRRHVFVGAAGVDDKRQAGLACGSDLPTENRLLNLGRGIVVSDSQARLRRWRRIFT